MLVKTILNNNNQIHHERIIGVKAKPSEIYVAWLDYIQHSNMTGGPAKCSNKIGGTFTAWDAFIAGQNIELMPRMLTPSKMNYHLRLRLRRSRKTHFTQYRWPQAEN